MTHIAWIGDYIFFQGGKESFLALRIDYVIEKYYVILYESFDDVKYFHMSWYIGVGRFQPVFGIT